MLIIAHRGASAEAVENTKSSFRAALRSQAHMLETDLRLTRDGHLVLHHDATTRRLLGVTRIIARQPLKRLLMLRYANRDQILTVAQLFALVQGKLAINLELKAAGTARALLEQLERHPYAGMLLISSPHLAELREVRERGWSGPLGPVLNTLRPATWEQLEQGRFQFVSLQKRLCTSQVCRRLRDLGLRVFVYTVNDPADMVKFHEAGVAGIFTDHPALAARTLRALPQTLARYLLSRWFAAERRQTHDHRHPERNQES
jgi:glycerophosphoryl diester phosphodiesterase